MPHKDIDKTPVLGLVAQSNGFGLFPEVFAAEAKH